MGHFQVRELLVSTSKQPNSLCGESRQNSQPCSVVVPAYSSKPRTQLDAAPNEFLLRSCCEKMVGIHQNGDDKENIGLSLVRVEHEG